MPQFLAMYWIPKLSVEVTPLPPTPIAERLFAVTSEGKLLFLIGFERLSLLADFVYITMEPREGLKKVTPSLLKALRNLFAEYPGYIYYCQIDQNDKMALHWAKFFGFKQAGDLAFGRIQLEKDTR